MNPYIRLCLPATLALQLFAHQLYSQPAISALSPESGPVGSGVTIMGTGFTAVPSENVVFFGPVQAGVTQSTSTTLHVTVPAGATFSAVTVIVDGLTAVSGSEFRPTFPGPVEIAASSFAPRVDFPTGRQPTAHVVADLDGDGRPDIVVVNRESRTISVFRNISSPGLPTALAARMDFPIDGVPYGLAVADMDGDGKLDVIVGGGSVVSVFRNISTVGNLAFSSRLDLPAGVNVFGLSVGDLDGDGRMDIAVANHGSNNVSVYRNVSTPGSLLFAQRVHFSAGAAPYFVAIGDVDGDGKRDLVVANSGSATISILRNVATPGQITSDSFLPKVDLATPQTPLKVAIGDLDGDGKADIAVACYSGRLSVFRNVGTSGSISPSSFAARADWVTGGSTKMVAISGLSGDGNPDVITMSEFSNTVSIFRNVSSPGSAATTWFAPKIDLLSGANPNWASVADLNGDGRPDLIVNNQYAHTLSVFQHRIPPPVEIYANSQQLTAAEYNFIGPVTLVMETDYADGSIFYTLDGSAPSFDANFYRGPVVLQRSAIVRAIAYSADFLFSDERDAIAISIVPLYSLLTSTPGGGSVTLNPSSGPYQDGATVSVTANPMPGWSFLGWLGDADGTNATIEISMTRNKAVQAVFGTSLSTTIAGNGSITVHPEMPLYPYGSEVTLIAIPQPGNYFGAWGNTASGNTNPLTLLMTMPNPTVSSVFAPLPDGEVTLLVRSEGLGSATAIPRANRYSHGQWVTLTATPRPGQAFIGWSGDLSGNENPRQITMTSSKTIVANFTANPKLAIDSSRDEILSEGVRLTLTGELGRSYLMEFSTDLAEWLSIGTFANRLGTVQVRDETAIDAPFQFYRAQRVSP